MLKPHLEIFDKKRLEIFEKLPYVSKDAILTGGTALALQLGHRKSYDFDLALETPIEKLLLRKVIEVFKEYKITPQIDSPNELTFGLTKNIKVTYFHYPFPPLHPSIKIKSQKLHSFYDLASNKTHTIGRRGEWKDYVDVYFLLVKGKVVIEKVIKETKVRFGDEFNEKLFWEQLVYWEDIQDFEIEYIGKPLFEETIQNYFKKLVKDKFNK